MANVKCLVEVERDLYTRLVRWSCARGLDLKEVVDGLVAELLGVPPPRHVSQALGRTREDRWKIDTLPYEKPPYDPLASPLWARPPFWASGVLATAAATPVKTYTKKEVKR